MFKKIKKENKSIEDITIIFLFLIQREIINDKEIIIANISASPPFIKNKTIDIKIPNNKKFTILYISSFLINRAKKNIINMDIKAIKLSPPLPQKLINRFFEKTDDSDINSKNKKLIIQTLLYFIFCGLIIWDKRRKKENKIK